MRGTFEATESELATGARGRSARTVGPYTLLAQIGEGGMGVVYRASHPKSGVHVALKTVAVPDASHLAGMRREIDALRCVNHPGIVRIVDAGVEAGVPWYAMELLDGRTLRDVADEQWNRTGKMPSSNDAPTRVARKPDSSTTPRLEKPISGVTKALPSSRTPEMARAAGGNLRSTLTLFRKLCEPLAFLHGEGFVHGDLKPSNVVLREDGTPVLVDFGLVWRFAGAMSREIIDVAGVQAGTAGYMAPEQIAGELVDARADLYALGCMLYEAVTGRLPFVGARAIDVIQQHIGASPIPPSHLVEGVPTRLEELILRLLAKRPRERIGHSDAVVTALHAAGADIAPARGPAPRAYLYRPELSGRDAVVAELRTHLVAARRGSGSLAVVEGESGIGKTYVGMELARVAASDGMRVIACACRPLRPSPGPRDARGGATTGDITDNANGTPLYPFRTVLEAVADRCLEEGEATTARLLGARATVLAEIAPDLAALPGVRVHGSPPPLPAAAAQHRLLTYLGDTLTAFAAARPLFIIIDDLQWADELSLRFLTSLGEAHFRHAGVFLLGTCRSEEMGRDVRDLLAAPFVHRVALGRLDSLTVRRLTSDMLALDDPGDAFIEALTESSGGNPFFVAEYLRTALVEGLLYRDDESRWRVRGTTASDAPTLARLPLPQTLRSLAGRRIEGLSATARVVVDVASVLGREVFGEAASTLGRLAGAPDEVLLPAIQELCAQQILEASGDGYRFIHDKVREAAYALIDAPRKRVLHKAVALEIERELTRDAPVVATLAAPFAELAHHFKLAGETEKAVHYLEAAGTRALKNSSNREAVAYFRDALAFVENDASLATSGRRASWERQIGEAYLGLGLTQESRTHLIRAVSLVGRPLPATNSLMALGLMANALLQAGHRIAPERITPRAADERAALLEATRAYDLLMQIAYQDGGPIPVLHATLSALNLAERVGPSPELALAYANAHGTAGIIPLHGLAETYARRARETLRAVPDRAVETWLLLMNGVYRLGSGRWEEAREALEEAASIAEELVFKRRWEEAIGTLSALHFLRGDFEKARLACESYYASTLRGDAQGQFWALLGLSQAEHVRGNHEAALAILERAEPFAATQPGRPAVAWMHAEMAINHLRLGDLSAARGRVDQADALLQKEPPVVYFAIYPLGLVAHIHIELRRPDEARKACAALERFSRMSPIAKPRALLNRGRLLSLEGKKSDAARAYRKSLESARALSMPVDADLASKLV